MSEVAIRVENVHKSFRGGRDKVLNGLNVDFMRGELTYILGHSGAGKSVLLKHVLGLLHPDQGKIRVFDQDLSELSKKQLSNHRLNFGMLFQNSALFDDMTVYDNVAFPMREHTKATESEIEAKVRAALTHLGMEKGYDKYPNELSGGMKKRVALARAIIREPQILLYDEPTTGLDPITRTTVDELIEKLKSTLKLTSLVISHDIPSALRLADRIAFLSGGQIVFYGVASDFRKAEHPAIRAFLAAEETAARAVLQA